MASRTDEETPLLDPTPSDPPSNPAPIWQFWRSASSSKPPPPHATGQNGNHVHFASTNGDEDLEAYAIKRVRRRRTIEQALLYLILLALGVGLGSAFTRWRDRRAEAGEGPMVPPVWTLPPPTGLPRNPAYLTNATTAAVASEDITCSNLGLSIMREKNGTAVDAAITTTLCIGLLNAFSAGIGGGGFMVVRVPYGMERDENMWAGLEEAKQHGVVAIDFRETSPEKVEREMYGTAKAGRVAAQVGGLAVGVPGELRGLEAAHKLYGHLPWEELVTPVADIALEGWQVSRELARRIRLFGQFMLDSPTWSAVYAPRGYLAVEGDFIKRENYGRTLRKIAKDGAGVLYNGEIAESIVETVQSQGGVLSLKDLQQYQARVTPAVHQTWNGKIIYTTEAPSSGSVMLGMLNILEPYDIPSSGCRTPENIHKLIEAHKFAFGARSEVTDPPFASNLSRLAEFRTKAWADEARAKLTNVTHSYKHYGLQHETPVDHGTTHLSVVDPWGGAASVTSTVNLIWGSHVMDPKTGIIMNDEQDDFAIPGAADAFGLLPSPWNYPAPGKRPLSSTAATIILDQDASLWGVFGGSGGSRIFGSIVQVLMNLACGDDLSTAIERPRWHNQIVPGITTLEVGPEGEDKELIAELVERGHEIGLFDINVGAAEVQAIVVENGTIWASSDSRKNGVAAGY